MVIDKQMNDNFICPISLQNFTYPIVLDCGHTIDKPTFDLLQQKDKCPLCMQPNFSKDRVNWSLVSIMGLDIRVNRKNKLLTAKELEGIAKKEMDKQVTAMIENKIMPEIMKKIQAGLSGINIARGVDMSADIDLRCSSNQFEALKSILENLGYKLSSLGTASCFKIKW